MGKVFEWAALCVAVRGEKAGREGERKGGERERERGGAVCGLGVKTDRLLMDSSTFRCSDEVLAHRVKYS